MKIRDKSAPIVLILISLTVSTMFALFSGNIPSYSILNRPALSPPGFIFPIAWTIPYILMGVSSCIVCFSNGSNESEALLLCYIQLFFNFCWGIISSGLDLFLFVFIWLIILILIIIIMIRRFLIISPLSVYLQIPYLVWYIFAVYLSFSVFLLN